MRAEITEQVIHTPSPADVAMATAELILSIQAEYPEAKLKPLPPLEDEVITLEVWLPIPLEQRLSVQHRIAELQGDIMNKHGVFTVALALPFEDASSSNQSSQ